MAEYATTKLSSKGQVVIPKDIRRILNLKEGDQFVVIGQGDSIIFKSISPPPREEFKSLMAEARQYAKKAKLKKSSVKGAIKQVRKSSR